jgi:putative acetyltransferase
MALIIRQEHPADREAVYRTHQLAFGRDDEARLVDALREGGYGRVALVAESAGEVVGHVLFSRLPVLVEGGVFETLALAPLAVVPDHQRRGVGSALVRRGLEDCRAGGHRAVVVLGHPDYYPRFGFSPALAAPLAAPFSGDSFMAVELVPGALRGVTGRVVYPEPFHLA